MQSPEIRERFLDFFQRRGHLRLPSASLLTYDDPTVLFTVAGVVPLKPYITGSRPAPAPRVTSCQKCFRGSGVRDDVEEVGDTSHHTFFEMLGNWSFGDYFKRGAIEYAWELLTVDLGLPAERLVPSIHPTDTESLRLWGEVAGVPAEGVSRLEENWWQIGPTGPCGWDSEVYFDWGGPCACGRTDCRPEHECGGDRWTEIWNLVFMEFDQAEDGSRTPLPRPTVDTGMGFERITAVLQGVRSNYDTDLFAPILAGFRGRAAEGPPSAARAASFNVLADHLRSAVFLVADGVYPGNEGRGYALRRVIRRAAIHGRRLGLHGGLVAGVDDVVAVMGSAYPELVARRDTVVATLAAEEEAFAERLADGVDRLEALLAAGAVSGSDAFRLHDTYGFPIELTTELARERGVAVDTAGFAAAMAEQRERSRRAVQRVGFTGGPALPATEWLGDALLEGTGRVLFVEADGGGARVVLDRTPFYAEAGGQVGDRGTLTTASGSELAVVDTRYLPGNEVRVHILAPGTPPPAVGEEVTARVDADRRGRTMRHHSATHLLNQALRRRLGPVVEQRGSLVDAEHATFDFSHPRALSADELREVERAVNDAIRADLERVTRVLPIAEARQSGAIAMAGERYPDEVRVVAFGDWSVELCGGTHVRRTGEIGAAVLAAESSVGTGIRRIELLVGAVAEAWWEETADRLRAAAAALRAAPAEVPERVAALQQQVRRLERELAEQRRRAAAGGSAAVTTTEVDGLRVATRLLDSGPRDDVTAAADALLGDHLAGDGVAVAVGPDYAVVKVGGAPLARGVDSVDLLRTLTAVAGGRGGGRPERAQGGITEPDRREAALAAVRARVADVVGAPA